MRTFALLGEGDDVIGMEEELFNIDGNTIDGDKVIAMNEHGASSSSSSSCKKNINNNENEFSKAKELSLHMMGAGGGSISAMSFLPRDTGIGDDQLIATGDTRGVVGIYDARTGKCQGTFGIPVPPGINEEGVSNIICLNPHDGEDQSGSVHNSSSSHSALILAGSFDGGVAVFKKRFFET